MNIQFGKFKLSFGRGTDSFTKTYVQQPLKFDGNQKEVWLDVIGNEYQLYSTTPEIYIVFNRFAKMFSNGRFVHKKMDGTEKGKIIEDSKFVALLESPNPIQSGEEFKIECALHYLIYGNRITYPIWGSSLTDAPSILNNLPPEKIKIELNNLRFEQYDIDSIIKRYCLENYGSETKYYKASELIHHKNIDPDNPFKGISPIVANQMPITNIRGAYGFRNANINKRGALGFVSSGGKDMIGPIAMDSDDRKDLSKQFSQEDYGHGDNQSSIAITKTPASWEHTAYPINQMMLFEEISEDMKRLIDSIGLNDNIFSKEKSKIQANLNEGLKMAYQDGIIPFSQDFCSTFTKGLKMPDGEWLELDYSHIPALQEDKKANSDVSLNKAKTIETLVKAGYSKEEALIIIQTL